MKLTEEERRNLLPCPHCGSADLELSNTHTACYTIQCLGCEEQGFRVEVTGRAFGQDRPSDRLSRGQHLRAKKSAVAAWNRRASTSGE